jgi:hypothetical protein
MLAGWVGDCRPRPAVPWVLTSNIVGDGSITGVSWELGPSKNAKEI